MVQLNKNEYNMIDCMGKYYLKQMIFLALYLKEHICVIKKISLKVGFNLHFGSEVMLRFCNPTIINSWDFIVLSDHWQPSTQEDNGSWSRLAASLATCYLFLCVTIL